MASTIGIDYSGAETPTDSLNGLVDMTATPKVSLPSKRHRSSAFRKSRVHSVPHPPRKANGGSVHRLRFVGIHREFITAATRQIMALTLLTTAQFEHCAAGPP